MREKYRLTKLGPSNKLKKAYFLTCLLIISVIGLFQLTKALYYNTEKDTVVDVKVGDMHYQLSSTDFLSGTTKIEIGAGEKKEIEITLTSLNQIDSKYEIYYETYPISDLTIYYSSDVESIVVGEIGKNGEKKKAIIVVANNSGQSQTIEIKINAGYIFNDLALYNRITNEFIETTVEEYGFTGNYQIFTAPRDGNYKIELWGASGGGKVYAKGLGGYTKGTIYLVEGEKIYIYVGGQGTVPSSYTPGGYNGGGGGGNANFGATGGGATDIRYFESSYTPTSTDLVWNSNLGLRSRIMVAGGGGGSGNRGDGYGGGPGGDGGGLVSNNSVQLDYTNDYCKQEPKGATQTGPGEILYLGGTNSTCASGTYANQSGTDGHDGFGKAYWQNITNGQAGGGGGYYGGGSGGHCGTTGGSSYISGHTGSVAITSSTDQTPKSGCTNGTTDNNCSIHYSGKKFTDTLMLSGNQEMPAKLGFENSVGNNGDGYAKITYLDGMGIVKKTLKNALLANNIIKTTTPDFASISTDADSGIYKDEDDYGISYYFRGTKTILKNNVIFAGYQWKVIRINGDGSIRLIYNGECPNNNCSINTTGTATQISGAHSFNTSSADNRYIGYMYGTSCDTYNNCHANINQSHAKIQLDNWYKTGINSILLKDNGKWHNMVADVIYCNDRSIYSGTGAGVVNSFYGPQLRIEVNKNPSLKCPNINDQFTLIDSIRGNKKLTFPVGLITADEGSMAGGVMYVSSPNIYLDGGTSQLTMSPNCFYNSAVHIHRITGPTMSVTNTADPMAIRPVISLKLNVKISGGDGSTSNPFVIK